MRGKVANLEKKPAEPRPWSIVATASRLVTVAHAGLGEQVAGTSRVVFQLAAQPGHMKTEIVGALLEPGPPDHGQDLRRRHELAGPVEQDGQDAPFGGRQPERRPLPPPAIGRAALSQSQRTLNRSALTRTEIGPPPPALVRCEVAQPVADGDLVRPVPAE